MSGQVVRIPVQAERDRTAVVQYLIELAGYVASGRTEVDPFGVVVILVGPDSEDVGSRGVRYRHDYLRADRALRRHIWEPVP